MDQDILYDTHFSKFLNDRAFVEFFQKVEKLPDTSYISLSFPIEELDPLACLEMLSQPEEFRFFWESPGQSLALAAGKTLIPLQADGSSRFEAIGDQINHIKNKTAEYSAVSHAYSGLNFLGGFSFHPECLNPVWKPFGAASFTVPEWTIIKNGKLGLLTINLDITECGSTKKILDMVESKLQTYSTIFSLDVKDVLEAPVEKPAGSNLFLSQSSKAYERWVQSVNKAKSLISENRFGKIVLAREFELDMGKDLAPTHVIHDLRQQYPNCYSFLISEQGNKTFIGCSPERLAAFRDRFLLTEALAGSIQRGTTATQDALFAKELLSSRKNVMEHDFVIKAIVQKLKPFSLKTERDEYPTIKKFANVQHLYTPVTARLRDHSDRLAILKALHPTPAVGGYPWEKASGYIRDLEHFDRGWYAGPVGWLNSKGDGEFTVAIRSGLVEGPVARFFAGCGIVADSNPDAEWRETSLKLIPMLSVLRYD